MKVKLWSAILCSGLLLCVSAAKAQSSAAVSGATDDSQAQQTPPPAQTPPQNPPATVPGTPSIPKPTVQLPPSAPESSQPSTMPPQHDTEGDYFSIEPMYWLTKRAPVMAAGKGNSFTAPGGLDFPGHSKYGLGATITIPTSRENSLQFTYFRIKGQGNSTLPDTVNFFGNEFSKGDILASGYTVNVLKLSWNYLTWPYPSKGAKFRVKTLWEMQYAQLSGSFDAPADTTAISTFGSKRVILPTLGLGAEYHVSRYFYLNLKASGFGILHHADIVDGEADAVLHLGRIEAMIGDRYYHFKTSPQSDEYFSYTLTGPFVGLRYDWR